MPLNVSLALCLRRLRPENKYKSCLDIFLPADVLPIDEENLSLKGRL